MEKVSKSAFGLLKVKADPKGGLTASYQVTVTDGNEPVIIERQESCTADVHPDLRNALAGLRTFVRRCFALPEEFEAKIEVRGAAWSGIGDGTGVVLTSILEAANGLKSALNTPRIKTAQESFGFEPELEAALEVVKDEVYAYLYEGKRAQLSLFGEGPLEEPENAFE